MFPFDAGLNCVCAGGRGLWKIGLSADSTKGETPHPVRRPQIQSVLTTRTLDGTASAFEHEYGGERYRTRPVPVRTSDEERTRVMERLAEADGWEYNPEADTVVSTGESTGSTALTRERI